MRLRWAENRVGVGHPGGVEIMVGRAARFLSSLRPNIYLDNKRDMRYNCDMPDCNIRNVDESLMRAMKSEAAKTGRTLRDWVIWVWAANVGWEVRDGLGKVSAVAERVERPAGSSDGHAEVAEDELVAEDENRCPECGEALVWNKVMKYWECVCGWHGKRER